MLLAAFINDCTTPTLITLRFMKGIKEFNMDMMELKFDRGEKYL